MCMSWYFESSNRSASEAPYFFWKWASASLACRGIHWRMIVFIGWSALPQSTPIHLIPFRFAQTENSRSGPGCCTM